MTTGSSNDNVLFWDRFAGKYDRFTIRFARGYPDLVSKIAREIGPSDRVLEVAAGTGLISTELAAVADRVDAVDLSSGMVEIGRKKAEQKGLTNLHFQTQSAYHLEFPDESFDKAVCANALHIMEHPQLALGEIRRVLKPGGRLIAPTYCHGERLFARLVSKIMCLTSGFQVFHRYTIAELRSLMQKNGFEIIGEELIPQTIPLYYSVIRKALEYQAAEAFRRDALHPHQGQTL